MKAVALPRRGLAGPGVAPCNAAVPSTLRNALVPVPRSASHVIMASGSQVPGLPGSSVVPQPSAGRAVTGGKSPQRTFSVMQSAMKIPGLASALHLIGVHGGHDATSNGSPANGVTTVAAAGSNGAGASPEESSPPTASPQRQHPEGSDAAAAGADAGAVSDATEAVYEMAAAAASSANGRSFPAHQPLSAAHAGGMQANGHAKTSAQRRHGSHHQGDDGLNITDPVTARMENNIAPYSSGMPSLAVQIRDIASTLRQINGLRVEYLEKISQQELELVTKDQALRSREERIQELENEKADLQRSLALLHSAKAAAEAEVQRLRAAAAAAPALLSAPSPTAAATPASTAADAAAAAAAAPAPTTSTAAPQPEAQAAATTTSTAAMAPAAPPPPPPQLLTTTTPAVVASAPAAAAAPAPTPAPPPPPPPPPARVPEIVLSYRSSWPEAYMQVNVDGRGWTATPGLRMEHAGAKEYTLRLQARSIEFVLTNGTGEWDGPGGGPGRNYHIDTPGEYRLHYGTLTQTKVWQP